MGEDIQFKVHLGLQPCQHPMERTRGAGRYVRDLARTLVKVNRNAVGGLYIDSRMPSSELEAEFGESGLLRTIDDCQIHSEESAIDLFHITWNPPSPGPSLKELLGIDFFTHASPLIATLYDLTPYLYPDIHLRKSRALQQYNVRLRWFTHADMVITISQAVRSDAIKLLGLDPARVVAIYPMISDQFTPHPISTQAAWAELPEFLPSMRHPFILYVGGLDGHKNVRSLIDAFSLLPARLRKSTQFVLVSPHENMSTYQDVLAYARRRGIGDQIVPAGFVNDSQLVTLYRACRLFVMPSFYEGFGLPVAEAMKCGAPVLVSNRGALPELVEPVEAQFDPDDGDGLARSIETALTDEAFQHRLKEYGLERSKTFSRDRLARDLLATYSDVANRFAWTL